MVSLNLKRRHLSESQRAMVAARVANMRQGTRTDLEPCANLRKVSQPQAAEMLNVSERSVQHAAKIEREAIPEVTKAVEPSANWREVSISTLVGRGEVGIPISPNQPDASTTTAVGRRIPPYRP